MALKFQLGDCKTVTILEYIGPQQSSFDPNKQDHLYTVKAWDCDSNGEAIDENPQTSWYLSAKLHEFMQEQGLQVGATLRCRCIQRHSKEGRTYPWFTVQVLAGGEGVDLTPSPPMQGDPPAPATPLPPPTGAHTLQEIEALWRHCLLMAWSCWTDLAERHDQSPDQAAIQASAATLMIACNQKGIRFGLDAIAPDRPAVAPSPPVHAESTGDDGLPF